MIYSGKQLEITKLYGEKKLFLKGKIDLELMGLLDKNLIPNLGNFNTNYMLLGLFFALKLIEKLCETKSSADF